MQRWLLLTLVCCFAASTSWAADAERYQLKEDTKLFGFAFGRPSGNAEFVVPFDKSYPELSAKQQALLRSAYVEMGDADEPPFPVGGLKAIYEPITEGQQRLMVTGWFRADVEIDEQGDPVALAVYRTPSKTVTKFVAAVVMQTKFKAAVCGGSPCKMGFPVRIGFETRR